MKSIVVIPAYNEGRCIRSVVRSILDLKRDDLDVLVVNDGSRDNTSVEASAVGAIVIDLPQNLGIGGAVQTGYLYALYNGYDAVIQIDGDGQHNPKDLDKLLTPLFAGEADMVIGSRFVEKTDYKPSFFRQIGINFFAKVVSRAAGQRLTDTTSGYRAVNRKCIRLFAAYYPSDYPEVETILYALSQGASVKEVSVDMENRQAGKSSITPLKSLYYMIKVTFAILLLHKGEGK